MKKNLFSLLAFIPLSCLSLYSQVISIADVQGRAAVSDSVGKKVTVRGAVTGTYSQGYFIRDTNEAWGGIYVYDQAHKPLLGDTIQLTATVDEYYNWTELKTLSSYSVISTGNPAPVPVSLKTGNIDESWESCLVTVSSANCTSVSLGYGEWQVNDGSGPAVVNDLGYAFTPKLNEKYSITGNISFSFDFYKIEPRFAADVSVASVIFFGSAPYPSSIGKNSITLNWTSNIPGTTVVKWGLTQGLESGEIVDTANTLSHEIKIEGLLPATFYFIKAVSFSGTDQTLSEPLLFSTASESSGEIRVYFNQAGIPPGINDPPGLYTSSLLDTMISFVNLAQSTLDLALYDFTNHASFSDNRNLALVQAINNAFNRGVKVRFITDSKVSNEVLADLDPGIPILKATHDGIMHDKFILADRESITNSWLITGSTNPTYNNLVLDFNNLLAIQDQSLTKAYTLEFNEMWGGDNDLPVILNSRFSSDKKDNTPHFFLVGGKRIEVYFSPSDLTTNRIVNTLGKAENRIDFAVMAFTEDLLGNALVSARNRDIRVKGIIDYVEYSGSEYNKLRTAGIKVLDYANPGGAGWPDAPTLHHKFAIVDAGSGNAAVITGSHNWTASAESINDENTLIIHDKEISELFKAESERIYRWLRPMTCNDDTFQVWNTGLLEMDVLANDSLPPVYSFSISQEPKMGFATIGPDQKITYGSMLNCLCNIDDTLVYEVCYENDPDYCLQARVFISIRYSKEIYCNDDSVELLENGTFNLDVTANDSTDGSFTLTILKNPMFGTANPGPGNTINFQSDFCCGTNQGKDTIIYQLCFENNPGNCITGNVFINYNFTTSAGEYALPELKLYPVPVNEELFVISSLQVSRIEIRTLTGRLILRAQTCKTEFSVPVPGEKGVYFIRLELESGEVLIRKVVKL